MNRSQVLLFVVLIFGLNNPIVGDSVNHKLSNQPVYNIVEPHNGSHVPHHGNDSELHHDNHSSEHHEYHGIHVISIKFDYVKQPLIVSLFMIAVTLIKIGFHHANFLSSWMPESCALIVLGTVVGGILHAAKVDTADFYYIHPDSFFLFLLPPCILEAAYGLHDPVFFENLGTILFYAVIGTLFNCFIIGPALYGLALCGAMGSIDLPLIQAFVFSSLIVAVDPVAVLAIFEEIGVNNVLYFLVFGESLLNDAVTVVLYNTITTLSEMPGDIPPSEIGLAFAAFFTVSLGGLSIGLIFGFITALITRLTDHVRMVEPLAIFSLAYASYLMAELFHFSGIISIIGCGLIQMQYAFHNISSNSNITIKYFSKMLSGACDSIIFLFLGLALVRDDHVWQTGFVLWSALLCLVVRFLVTYCLTFIANRTNRVRSVEKREQFIMAYGGLRGAVAFCLVAMLNQDVITNKNLFQTATLFIILFTVFIQGITIKPLVNLLHIEKESEKIVCLCQEINSHVTDHLLVFMEEVIGHYGHNKFQQFLTKLDDKYLKPILQRDPFTKDEVIMEIYQQIALQQHYETVYGADVSSSRIQLYQPDIAESGDMPLNPEIIKRSMDDVDHMLTGYPGLRVRSVMAAKRLSNRRNLFSVGSMSTEDDDRERNVYDTVRSLPATVIASKPELKKMLSLNEESENKGKKDGWERAKHRLMDKMRGVPEDEVFVAAPTAEHLRKWMVKAPNKDAYARRPDRNLKAGDKGDILNLLHEKQRRHERMMRGTSVISPLATPFRSRAGSLDGDEEQVPRMRRKTQEHNDPVLGNARAKLRERHKTVDMDPQGHVKYTPKYRSSRPISNQLQVVDTRRTSDSEKPAMQIINEENSSKGTNSQNDVLVPLIDMHGKSGSVDSKHRGHLQRQDADERLSGPVSLQKLSEADL